MKKKYTFARIFYAVFTVLATLAGAAGLTLLYIKNADPVDIDGNYQTVLLKSNGYTAAFIAFACCAVVILALSCLIYRKASAPTDETVPKNLSTFVCAVCGLFVLATAVMQFVMDTAHTPYGNKTLSYIMAVLAIPAALYFLWPAIAGKCQKGLRMFFGITVAAWLCCTALALHFFMDDFLNSPTRVVSMLSCCFLIFFFLADVRRDTPGVYVPLGLVAAFFAIPDGASKVILSFMRTAGFSPNISAFYALARLALGLYALISVICCILKAADAQTAVETAPEAVREVFPDREASDAVPENVPAAEDAAGEGTRSDADPTVEAPDDPELPKE